MRYSYQRETIESTVKSVKTHPTAQEVYEMVQDKIPNISLGTVYRNLQQLVKHEKLLEVSINGVSHFDGDLSVHQHFYCSTCESIFDIFSNLSDSFNSDIESMPHNVDTIDIRFKGTCENCNT